jgi:hypothetical protein
MVQWASGKNPFSKNNSLPTAMLTDEQRQLLEKLSRIDSISAQLLNLSQDATVKMDELKKYEADATARLQSKVEEFGEELRRKHALAEEDKNAVDRMITEKTQGFPWLADAISQYNQLKDLKLADYLESKSHPAAVEARRIREIASEKREHHKKWIITRNLIRYYEALFPWLQEYVGEDIDELLVQMNQKEEGLSDEDPTRHYLAEGEYDRLSAAERNQRALDRYWKSRKSSWQVGRDYERYIGFLYEREGFSVQYQGIEKELEDLGRDLICRKRDQIEIVQCKYWREEKTIHEKHINQLFGTTVKFYIESLHGKAAPQLDLFPSLMKERGIHATFITSAHLSDVAKEFASVLGITPREGFPFKRYPCIKCNVSRKDGSKIYHLPFDQQYDRTTIEEERNECYVETTAEAEALGFRRAWRWRGDHDSV